MKSEDAPIHDVTVYPSGSLVKRVLEITIEPGSNEVVLEDLTSELDPSSVRVKGSGTVAFRNDGQDVKKTAHLETPDEKIQELLETIKELDKKKRSIKNTLGSLEKRQEWLVNIGHGFAEAYPIELAKGKSKPDDIVFTKRIFDEELEIKTAMDENRDELAIIENTLRIVNSRLNRSKVKKASYTVTIYLENLVDKPGEIQLEITYFCSRASWYSGYDLRLSENEGNEAEMDYNGFVSNWTGEDWENVTMTLSTAIPTLGMDLPAFQPWYVKFYRALRMESAPGKPRGKKMKSARPAPAPPMEKEMDLFAVLDEEPAPVYDEVVTTSTVEKTGENIVYRLSLPVDLPSDGKAKKQLITREKVKLEKSYYTFPASIQSVFQKGKVVNATDKIFLPGSLNIFMGAEFAGTTSISKILPNQSFTISLGESSSIKVLRKLKSKSVDKKGLTGKTREHEVTYTITLQNLSETTTGITILDRLPHPEEAEIKVTLTECKPQIKLKDLSKLEWKINLPPLKKEIPIFDMDPQISYTFALEYPGHQTLENFSP
ncbi:MAG: mucoidy inhibitor MuiA family protein [Candidatus Hodarchaeales archaeon]